MADPSVRPDGTPAESQLEVGGAYELIKSRLDAQGSTLRQRTSALNERRLTAFGSTESEVIGTVRVRTENNCVPRDIAIVGERMVFGYNVFIGLKSETKVSDVLSLQELVSENGETDMHAVPLGQTLLDDPNFVREFAELHTYYKQARLLSVRDMDLKLLVVFQTGATLDDLKAFRWATAPDGSATYIDNRGERDNVFPPTHDFEWIATTREDQVIARDPYIAIRDQVFISIDRGSLQIRVEDNTEAGALILSEPVAEATQSLADARVSYCQVGGLVLLKILPYNEVDWRYIIVNGRAQSAVRIDALGQSCVQLPEDQGLIFPGGYYLRNGEAKRFDGNFSEMRFMRMIRSPNGEDALFVFHNLAEGRFVLFIYNMIRKEVQNPIHCHGYGLFDDGRMVVFRADSEEPTRTHPMQIWRTPFASDEYAAQTPTDGSYLAKVGNADLVRGISDGYSLCRMIDAQTPTMANYEDLIAYATRMLDSYHWLDHGEVGDLASSVKEIRQTAELVIDEFEKVQAIQAQSKAALAAAESQQAEIVGAIRPQSWQRIEQYVDALARLRRQRGQLISLREMRYIDLGRIDTLEQAVAERTGSLSKLTIDFLLGEHALTPYHKDIDRIDAAVAGTTKMVELTPLREALQAISDGLDLLTDIVANLQIGDATRRTEILERISEVFAKLNRTKATADLQRKALLSREGVAEFAAQFKLLTQSVTSAISVADTPEKCDDALSRLLVQLEELESRFSEFDQFLEDLAKKREEVYDAFESKKQYLLEERQRRAHNLARAAERILAGMGRRAASFGDADALNTFFAADAMVLKVRELAAQLRELGDSVRADDIESQIKTARDQALRSLRDRLDIYEEGGASIRMGRHRFSVNAQPLDLTLVPRDEQLAIHLSGTEFFQVIDDPALNAARQYWDQALVSETADVYRGEFLAAQILFDAQDNGGLRALHDASREAQGLMGAVRRFAEPRYAEGYERGIHDADAAAILHKLLTLESSAGLLRFSPRTRALAQLFWFHHRQQQTAAHWLRRCRNARQLAETFGDQRAIDDVAASLSEVVGAFLESQRLAGDAGVIADYLSRELSAETPRFAISDTAQRLASSFWEQLGAPAKQAQVRDDLAALAATPGEQWWTAQSWANAYLTSSNAGTDKHASDELSALLIAGGTLAHEASAALTKATVTGLLGQHPRIVDRTLAITLDEFLARLRKFSEVTVPEFRAFRELRHQLAEREREALRLDEFKPRVMTAFVRNKLINDAYLPIIGDNLAKQMGALGAGKRTDLMGMLLLISPPGYGKTTLMEYIAERLGLVFVKINCPAVGHAAISIDPADAPNATARQELQKLNLALEMGNNVMLYLDDIQHTNPEFLQKFISLCDAQRKIEGVWRGRSKTYDLRGKKFCVVMAGNPYTESGEMFKIPDMLANRADVYNLGEFLSGKGEIFALSYIENALTSNATLAPLASRDLSDLYKLIQMAQGAQIASTELAHGYSSAEIDEIVSVLKKLMRIQQVVLKVNQQYIASASQKDDYRTEPPFKLQGSYRNMNKMAEKVVAVMNDQELEAVMRDHYTGESRTLTTGSEENLLKLHELLGTLSPEQAARWEQLKTDFRRALRLGGGDADPVTRVVGQLDLLGQQIESIQRAIADAATASAQHEAASSARLADEAEQQKRQQQALTQLATTQSKSFTPYLERLSQFLEQIADTQLEMQIVNLPPPGLDTVLTQLGNVVEHTLVPLVQTIGHNLKSDTAVWQRLGEVSEMIKAIDARIFKKQDVQRQTVKPFKSRHTPPDVPDGS